MNFIQQAQDVASVLLAFKLVLIFPVFALVGVAIEWLFENM